MMSEEMSEEQARMVLERERQSREMACLQELRQVLQKHRCRLAWELVISEEGIAPRIFVRAL